MMHRIIYALLALLLAATALTGRAQAGLYFPPLTGNAWDTLHPDSLHWCPERIDALYHFLDSTHARAFIVLKDGHMVLEKYFGSFTADSTWYWGSAAKAITATLVGIAQQESLLHIDDPVSQYLGEGWTSCSAEEELQRSIFHQLSMSSGFNTAPPFWNCISPSCFICAEDPGSQWHYHNGVYRRVLEVIEQASGMTRNQFTIQKLRNLTGMGGLWIDHLYFSRPRDMARFGLLALNDFYWGSTPVLSDTAYANAMRQTALPANPAYGYLWWLNGKDAYYAPLNFTLNPGWLIPTAPADLYAGMGANEQRVYVVPSQGLVVVRMGAAANESEAAVSAWDTDLWAYMAQLECGLLATEAQPAAAPLLLYPNPGSDVMHIEAPERYRAVRVYSSSGQPIKEVQGPGIARGLRLPPGFYIVEAHTLQGHKVHGKALVR